RMDELLGTMLRTRPLQQKFYVGKSVKVPRAVRRPVDRTPVAEALAIPPDSLLDRINRAVPRFRAEWRRDVIQDIALAIVDGTISEKVLDDLDALAEFRYGVVARYNDRWKMVSLDQPYRDGDANLPSLLAILQDETREHEEVAAWLAGYDEGAAE